MSVWVRDGFEGYNALGDLILGTPFYGVWNSSGGAAMAVSNVTRFGTGKSLQNNQGGGQTDGPLASGFANAGTVFCGCALYTNAALSASAPTLGITFIDSATAQCSIWMSADGSLQLRSGKLITGTLLATYSGAFQANQWNQFQFKIVFSASVGEFHVRKNGNTADDFSATGLNTIVSANAFANAVQFTNRGNAQWVDDFAVWDSSGGSPWNNFVGDFRAYGMVPNADSSVQFSRTNGGSTTFGFTTNAGSQTFNGPQIALFPFTPTCGGTISALTLTLNAGFTGKINCAIYDSGLDIPSQPTTGAAPGALLVQATEVTNPTTTVNFTLASTLALENGKVYWIALWTDQASYVPRTNGANASGRWFYNLAYSATFPASVQGLATNGTFNLPVISGTITATNFGMVNDRSEDGLTTYINDSVSGHQDLYGLTALPSNIATILGVDLIGMDEKSDAGAVQMNYLLKSGATTVTETAITPNTSFNYHKYAQDVDPNTSAVWTRTNLNAAQIGAKIV